MYRRASFPCFRHRFKSERPHQIVSCFFKELVRCIIYFISLEVLMMRAWMTLAALTGSYAMADQEFKYADEDQSGEAPSATQVSFFHPNGENPKPQPQRTCLVAVPCDVECEEVPPNAEDLYYAYEKYSIASYTNTKEKGHFFVTGDFIYWKPTEENLGYVALTTQTTFQNTISNPTIQDSDVELDIKRPHLKYQAGFEVGFGCDFPPEAHWDALVNWTDYRTKATSHIDIPAVNPSTIPNPQVGSFQITTLTPLGLGNNGGGFYNTASAAWRLHVDLLDLEIGRKFFIGKWVLFRPFFGVRAERIKESFQTAYNQPGVAVTIDAQRVAIDAKLRSKNNYNGIGLRMGLDSQWKIYRNFSLYGDGAASILYGQEKLTANNQVITANLSTVVSNSEIATISHYKNTQNASRAIFDLDAGIRWDQMFACGRCHIGLHVGWAYRYFIDQNQLMKTNNIIVRAATFASNGGAVVLQNNSYLSLQGLVVGGQLDF